MERAGNCNFCNTIDPPDIETINPNSTNKIQEVVIKHFWFTLDDLKNFQICSECRDKLLAFHNFYCQVENLYHKKLPKIETATEPETTKQHSPEPEYEEIHFEVEGITIKSEVNDSFLNEESDSKLEDESYTPTDIQDSDEQQLVDDRDKESPEHRVTDDDIKLYCQMNCELCSERFEAFNQLKKHYSRIHNKKGFVKCCNLRFGDAKRLKEHIKVHINPSSFQCDKCDKNFCSKRSLRCHQLVIHLPDDQKLFRCNICSKKYAKQYQLNQHLNTHTIEAKEENELLCPQCQKPYYSKGALRFHIQSIHERAHEVLCDICSKIFKTRSALTHHRADHFRTERVQCPTCGKWLKNENSLKKHMIRHKEEKLVIECDICGKRSPSSHALKKHIKDQHTSERAYQCTLCEKAFKRPIALKEHMATHTGQLLYSCVHCGKEYNSSANLCSHRKKAHPVEWREYQHKKEVNGVVAYCINSNNKKNI
ncbi:transcription factor grauzone-like [Topomyia yanbarensis]|uniref:transcription factor grauzone-like n=1 Tax=Topomyia yanbarensis TaxID=2498891 RepID=UPI00273C1486|nr:transcription factor grauzone-like [Topomyia yanbarensis]